VELLAPAEPEALGNEEPALGKEEPAPGKEEPEALGNEEPEVLGKEELGKEEPEVLGNELEALGKELEKEPEVLGKEEPEVVENEPEALGKELEAGGRGVPKGRAAVGREEAIGMLAALEPQEENEFEERGKVEELPSVEVEENEGKAEALEKLACKRAHSAWEMGPVGIEKPPEKVAGNGVGAGG